LKEHIRYITRKDECVYKHNLSLSDWGRRADSLLAKNSRSRIASKVVFALPNCLSAAEGAELLKEFLTKEQIFRVVKTKTIVDETGKKKRIRERIPVRLSESDFGFAIHEGRQGINKQRNLHAHVVFSSTKDGKKLDINRRELSELHRAWERFLKEKGYHLRKSPIRNEPHFGPSRLRFDRRARASFRHLSLAKKLWREAIEEEQIAKTLEKAIQVQGGEGLLSWDEIAQEEEEWSSKPTQGERKGESPPPRPSRLQQPKPVKQVKPVRSVKPVQQPRVQIALQRPSQVQSEEEVASKDPVKQIRKQVEKELAEKKRKERQLANEINYSLKQQARINSPPPGRPASYVVKKNQEVGMNPFVTQQVIEERREEVQFYETEIYLRFRYRKTVWGIEKEAEGTFKVRFRSLSDWSPEYRKGIAAFLASIVIARIYGFSFPSEALSYFGDFVRKEAVSVQKQIQEHMEKHKIKPLYPNSEQALKALSIKKTILVRVRVWQGDKLVEEHTFYLTEKSFTILHQYASEVRRRRPPEPGGQQPPEPPQGEPQQGYDEDEDYDRAPGM